MSILEHHQNGAALSHGFELMQQRVEHHLALVLQAEIERGGLNGSGAASCPTASMTASPARTARSPRRAWQSRRAIAGDAHPAQRRDP
jgi:hypothetical protein